ncbi:KGG domain-containing protein [Candidatus Paracaedibacter symbiosus]|uniref:KGG domain-containing protein n=1 Tax=Candidatus Paracaedibacter symbiosus TaxID=244582 RepID=UPI00068FE4A5|nr:KGG domain-containing protein [Candidatus Paracaedibacter symbiosus]
MMAYNFQRIVFAAHKDDNNTNANKSNKESDKNKRLDATPDEQKKRMHEAYSEIGKKGGETRAEQLGHEGYVEMGKKDGQARTEQMSQEVKKDSTKEKDKDEKYKK